MCLLYPNDIFVLNRQEIILKIHFEQYEVCSEKFQEISSPATRQKTAMFLSTYIVGNLHCVHNFPLFWNWPCNLLPWLALRCYISIDKYKNIVVSSLHDPSAKPDQHK